MKRTTIGVFGGTFDPIHCCHLRLALEVKQALALDQRRLMPCHRPGHRDAPEVSDAQRVEMLKLALSTSDQFQLDNREFERLGPSYSVDTLTEMRAELGPEASLAWILGSDAFAGRDRWHRWQELLDRGHLIQVMRPSWALPDRLPAAECLSPSHAVGPV